MSGHTKEQPLAVVCGSGDRSTVAGSILQRLGYRDVYDVVGSAQAWDRVAGEGDSGRRVA